MSCCLVVSNGTMSAPRDEQSLCAWSNFDRECSAASPKGCRCGGGWFCFRGTMLWLGSSLNMISTLPIMPFSAQHANVGVVRSELTILQRAAHAALRWLSSNDQYIHRRTAGVRSYCAQYGYGLQPIQVQMSRPSMSTADVAHSRSKRRTVADAASEVQTTVSDKCHGISEAKSWMRG